MSTTTEPQSADAAENVAPLEIDMAIESPSACLREVVVTIPKSEVARYLKKEYDEIVPEAQLPGFRSGRAPRALVEKQFKERVVERVKQSLLMDSLGQVTATDKFNAIGEPEFDFNSIKVPDDGDFKYQFSIEVRPDFDTPDWKKIDLKKPVETIDDEQIKDALARVLSRYAEVEATDEPAAKGDKMLISAKFKKDGKVIGQMEEERITLANRLTFADAVSENFGEVMVGAKEDETRTVAIKFSKNIEGEMAGVDAEAEITVIEVFKSELPKLTEEFLGELGDFENEDELKGFVRESLERQADYRTNQVVRARVTELLTDSANFELPPKLVRRQTMREIERKVMELRRNGFDEDMIRGVVNTARQNAQASTESALREHFILEQIAEDEGIDATEEEFEQEIELIAQQSDMPVRRVRARMEKEGQMDALRNQIVENKVIARIVEEANVTEEPVPYEAADEHAEFAVYHQIFGSRDSEAIPEAKYSDNSPKEAEKDK